MIIDEIGSEHLAFDVGIVIDFDKTPKDEKLDSKTIGTLYLKPLKRWRVSSGPKSEMTCIVFAIAGIGYFFETLKEQELCDGD